MAFGISQQSPLGVIFNQRRKTIGGILQTGKDRESLLFNAIDKLKIIMNIISYMVTFFIFANQINLEESHDFAKDGFRSRNVSDSFFKFPLHG